MTNFATEQAAAASDAAHRPAIRLDDKTLSYKALDVMVARAAGLLRAHGVGPGDRVGMQLPNDVYFPIVYWAGLRLGAVMVPMNPLLKGGEVAYLLSDAGAKVMLGWVGFEQAARDGCAVSGAECILVEPGRFDELLAGADAVEEIVERADDDAAVIIYTSGTTGQPKGATLTHANLRSGAHVARDLVDAGPDSVAVAVLPLFHVFGMNSLMNTAIVARGLLTLVARFDPALVLEVIQRDRATTFAGVPTMYTGDIATVDNDGYYFIVDRKKDLIIRGGYNVYPREIEEVFYTHPDVLEVAVVGVPHELLGEEVGAAVVLKPGAAASTDELREFVKSKVAAYKYPRVVWLSGPLPKGPTGKILKREIDTATRP